MGKRSEVYVSLKASFYELIKEKVKLAGITCEMLSKVVLQQRSGYLSGALNKTPSRLIESDYVKLLQWAGIPLTDYKLYIYEGVVEDTTEEVQPAASDDLIQVNKEILKELQIINMVLQEVRTACRLTANNTLNTKCAVEDMFKELGGAGHDGI